MMCVVESTVALSAVVRSIPARAGACTREKWAKRGWRVATLRRIADAKAMQKMAK